MLSFPFLVYSFLPLLCVFFLLWALSPHSYSFPGPRFSSPWDPQSFISSVFNFRHPPLWLSPFSSPFSDPSSLNFSSSSVFLPSDLPPICHACPQSFTPSVFLSSESVFLPSLSAVFRSFSLSFANYLILHIVLWDLYIYFNSIFLLILLAIILYYQ